MRQLGQAGRIVNRQLVVTEERRERPGYWAMRMLLESARPDAVFACSDVRALEAQQAIREASLKIPDDIAVIGFDNIELGKYSSPMLSMISQGITGGGAAELVGSILVYFAGNSGEETGVRNKPAAQCS